MSFYFNTTLGELKDEIKSSIYVVVEIIIHVGSKTTSGGYVHTKLFDLNPVQDRGSKNLKPHSL